MCGCYQKTPHSPRLCRAPRLGELAPHDLLLLGLAAGGGGRRGGTADTGEPGRAFAPRRYCTRENVSTKDHMAPFCMEPLDKGVGGGRGSCQKAHFQGALAPPTSDSRLAALGEWGHLSPRWLGSCDAPASLPPGRMHREGFCHRVLPISTLLARCTALVGREDWANSVLVKLPNPEPTKPPSCSGTEFGRLVNLERGKKKFYLYFHQPPPEFQPLLQWGMKAEKAQLCELYLWGVVGRRGICIP